jgi:hypothetical protein
VLQFSNEEMKNKIFIPLEGTVTRASKMLVKANRLHKYREGSVG